MIHAPVWHAMNDMSSRKPLFNARWVNDTMTFFKKTKTVQNPGTHITNIASNVTLAMMHGIPPRTVAKAAKLLWEFEVHPQRFKTLTAQLSYKSFRTSTTPVHCSALSLPSKLRT